MFRSILIPCNHVFIFAFYFTYILLIYLLNVFSIRYYSAIFCIFFIAEEFVSIYKRGENWRLLLFQASV